MGSGREDTGKPVSVSPVKSYGHSMFFYPKMIKPHFCLIKHFHRTVHTQQLEKTYFPSEPPSDIYTTYKTDMQLPV